MGRPRKPASATDDTAALLQRHLLPDGHFRPETSLAHAFTVVSTRVSTTIQNMYSERYGLTVVGWRLLAILGRTSPLSAKNLSDMTAMDQVTISRALEQLGSKRLLQRRIDPTDRRRTLLRLSKKGEDVYNQIVPVLYASERAISSVLTPDETEFLHRLMHRVVQCTAELMPDGSNWQDIVARYGYGADPAPAPNGAGTPPAAADTQAAHPGGDPEGATVPNRGDILPPPRA